jgi:hypothetical protein
VNVQLIAANRLDPFVVPDPARMVVKVIVPASPQVDTIGLVAGVIQPVDPCLNCCGHIWGFSSPVSQA